MTERAEPAAPAPIRGRLASMRILIVHEWLVTWAGSERCVEQMLELFPHADLMTGVMTPSMAPRNAVTRRAVETWLARVPGARSRHRWFLPLHPLAFASIDTSGYDLVISSSHAFAKCVRVAPPARHLCYCYSPPRYLYDLAHEYRREASVASSALAAASPVLRLIDRRAARRVDAFVAISSYIARRIGTVYGRPAAVVYPPVARKPVPDGPMVRGEAFLSLGRLVPYKRVDLAVLAANRLGAPLLVAGDGPERESLERIAGPTVRFLGEVSELEAGRLLEECRALVFCAEEDFGITPLEANAHGAPVVALGRGAVLETLRDGETAVLFDDPTLDLVCDAMRSCAERGWSDDLLRANAARFSAAEFRAGLLQQVEELCSVA